jgi:hypothetical protein
MPETPLLVLSRAGSYSMDNKENLAHKMLPAISKILTSKVRINISSKLPSNFFQFASQKTEPS